VVVVAGVQGVVIDEQRHIRYPVLDSRVDHLEFPGGPTVAVWTDGGSAGDTGFECRHEGVDFELTVRAPGGAVLFDDASQVGS